MALTQEQELAYRDQLLSIWRNDGLKATISQAESDGQNILRLDGTVANPDEVRANALNGFTYGNVSPKYIQNSSSNWIPWLIGGVALAILLKRKKRR